jgi:hypothetical protein
MRVNSCKDSSTSLACLPLEQQQPTAPPLTTPNMKVLSSAPPAHPSSTNPPPPKPRPPQPARPPLPPPPPLLTTTHKFTALSACENTTVSWRNMKNTPRNGFITTVSSATSTATSRGMNNPRKMASCSADPMTCSRRHGCRRRWCRRRRIGWCGKTRAGGVNQRCQ